MRTFLLKNSKHLVGLLFLACYSHLVYAQTDSNTQSLASVTASVNSSATSSTSKPPKVVVVLAGGGAKGFAHLAVLRRLEQDNVKISKIVATSMGAVIGGLYASGMSIDDIKTVIGGLDPSKVALDQFDRSEITHKARSYQQKYPVAFEFGVNDKGPSFARGVSDGQQFLALLQRLTYQVPADIHFDQLKTPFRAIATRYKDGELTVFDKGSLSFAIRASMAAPGVFAPIEVNGETYVDGGLVANLPIEIALQDKPDFIIASYLGKKEELDEGNSNALQVANKMLDILIKQNEKKNLSYLRPQDILVDPELTGFGFTDFNKAQIIEEKGLLAVNLQNEKFNQLKQLFQQSSPSITASSNAVFLNEKIQVDSIKVVGNQVVPSQIITKEFAALIKHKFDANQVSNLINELYKLGDFEKINYQLNPLTAQSAELQINIVEKNYGPHYFKTSLGFSTEYIGTSMYALGFGYRRPWLTESGLDLYVNASVGNQSELGVKLDQRISRHSSVSLYASVDTSIQPFYSIFSNTPDKWGFAKYTKKDIGVDLTYDLNPQITSSLGLVGSSATSTFDTAKKFKTLDQDQEEIEFDFNSEKLQYSAIRLKILADQLDSISFPTRGYYFKASAEKGVTGAEYESYKVNGIYAFRHQSHVLNFGFNLGYDKVGICEKCSSPITQYLGGFQSMGAYRIGQLRGEKLTHVYATYMYNISDGGVLKQPVYAGFVAEAGDVWYSFSTQKIKYSGTLFFAIDSKIGDIYLGYARGSNNNSNIFLQLGRRFNFI